MEKEMAKTKSTTARRVQKRGDLQDQYLEVVRMIHPLGRPHNSWLLWEQPETIVGQNFTTYSAGENPMDVPLGQK
jgi:hypothetical protein